MSKRGTMPPSEHKGGKMISVKEGAAKLGISDRRVRVLCEGGRIPGATRVGRAWILPDKPVVIAASRRRPGKVKMKAASKP